VKTTHNVKVKFNPGEILDIEGFVLPPLLILTILKPGDHGHKEALKFFGLFVKDKKGEVIVSLPLGKINPNRLWEGKFLFMKESAIAVSAELVAAL
jgi:hypothetical protein